MAPTLVNVALGALLAAALLGAAFDRRSVLIVVVAAMLPDIDAVASLVLAGATNALFHNVWIPIIFGGLLYWDTSIRARSDRSWIRSRYGWYGVRVAWVSLAAYVVAGIAPELFGFAGVNLLYPVHDAYYLVRGRLLFSTQEGVVQTFITLPADSPGILPLQSPGTTETYVIPTWINPDGRPGFEWAVDRDAYLVRSGWQAVVVASAVAVLTVRFLDAWAAERTSSTKQSHNGGQ